MTFQQQMCANCGKPLSPYWRDKCQHCKAPIAVARGYAQMAPQYGGYAPQIPVPPQYPAPYAPQPAAQYAPQPTPQSQGQRPPRVQSVLRGPDQASCLQQAVVDGERATANGYRPVWQSWGQDNGQVTLTILYDLAQGPAAAPGQPASVWTQPPASTSPSAPPMPGPTQAPTAPPTPPVMPPLPISVPTAQAPMPPPVAAPTAPPMTAPGAPPTQQSWSQTAAPSPPIQAPAAPFPQQQGWAGSQPAPQGPPVMPSLSQAPTRQTISSRVVGGIVSVIVIVIVWLVYAYLNRIL